MSILKSVTLFVSGMALIGCIGQPVPAEDGVAERVAVVQHGTNTASCLAKETLSERLVFAGKSRTGRLLREPDAFTAQAGAFDRGARMRTLEPTTTEDFLDFLSDHGQAWTADEKGYWSGIAEEVSEALAGLSLEIPQVLLAKTSGLEEFNAAYTRHNTIFFPRERLTLAGMDRGWDLHLFAHELFHILSINNIATRDALYVLTGFEPFRGLQYPEELEGRRITNPNGSALSYAHYVTVHSPDGPADVVPVIQSTAALEEIIQLPTSGRPAVFAHFGITLVAVDAEGGEALRDGSGNVIAYDSGSTNWAVLMTRNSDYIIHPDELLADNFAHIVNWRQSGVMPSQSWRGYPVNDPELLVAMQGLLTAACEE